MKYDNQLRYAVNIIKEYDGRYPLAAWLKDFFKRHKQMGSRDRKTVAELVYGYFRLGHNQFENIEERIIAGLYAGDRLPEVAGYFKAAGAIAGSFSPDKIFPWKDQLSDGMDADVFAASFLVQPDVFIRIRPGFEKPVTEKLNASGVLYSRCSEDCIALPNSTRIDTILALNREAVVQDKSSRQTGLLVKDIRFRKVWDCCAASGGKSLMIADDHPDVGLTVSDMRQSIIANLRARFKEAGIHHYRSFVADLTSPAVKLPEEYYDLVVADVPCSGSGTWSRTPEQLYFFKEERIIHYVDLQQKIVESAIKKLRSGGYLLYITCSVFRKENEDAIGFISSQKNMRLVKKELIKGYNDRADTMFAALFINGSA